MQDEPGATSPVATVPTTAEALWTATERLRALEEAAPVGIVAFDLEGRVTIWNRAAEELFGWAASEVDRPSRIRWIRRISRPSMLPWSARVLAGESLSGIETCQLRKDRIARQPSASPAVRFGTPPGEVCGTMQVLTDISEAKRLQQQFLQAQKMEAFGQLAGGIAHDFNNLLTVIIGFSELMTRAAAGSAGRPVATSKRSRRPAERASQLTRQLLAFSRKQMLGASGARPQRGRRAVREDVAAASCERTSPRDLARRRSWRTSRPTPARSSRC